jgi:O-antigen ligase
MSDHASSSSVRADPQVAAAGRAVGWAAAGLGFLPFVMTIKFPPSASFWAEWAAALAGILLLLGLGWRRLAPMPAQRARMPVAALGLFTLALLIALQLLAGMPAFVGAALLSVAQLALAIWLCTAASSWRDRAPTILDGFAAGLTAALAVNFVALCFELAGWQFHATGLFANPFNGRASGLLGQPNLLAAFAVMAWCGAHYLWWRQKLPAAAHVLASACLACILAASASRSGNLAWLLAFGLAVLGLRGLQPRRVGWGLLGLALLLVVGAQAAWSLGGLVEYFAVDGSGVKLVRLGREGRSELWRDSLQLIALHPFAGVGWRDFSAARFSELSGPMMEPNMGHAHNLLLNLAVELGLIGALLVLVPVGWALWAGIRGGTRRAAAPHQRLVAALLAVMLVYSMLEFPLWYLFFLLPFALLLGLAEGPGIGLPVGRPGRIAHLSLVALALVVCASVAVDYRRMERIYVDAVLDADAADRSVTRLPAKAINDIALLTWNDLYAELLLTRVLDADGLLMHEKLLISERVLGGLSTRETVARHVAFLVVAGKVAEAEAVLDRAGRNPDLRQEALRTLERLAAQHPALKRFVLDKAQRPAP